jgi:imidazolonepropionase-like amidohydrolase
MNQHILLPDRVFDSVTGQMLEDHAVRIEGDRIVDVYPSAGRDESEATHLPGFTLLPGLIDVHTHLAVPLDDGNGLAALVKRNGAQDAMPGVKHAHETLHAGFTTVRDIGAWRAFTDLALRDAIDAGWVPGPRMACAGAFVTCPGGGGDITGLAVDIDEVVPRELRFGVTSGVDQMRTTVRQILRYGADFIKVLATGAVLTSGTRPGTPEFTEDELRAAVETAQDAGSYVAAHAHGTVGIKRAIRAGVRSVEHGSMLDAEAIDLMLSHGTYLVADLYDGDYILKEGPALGYSHEVLDKTRETTEVQRVGFRDAVHAGVRVAFGSDAGVFPHGVQARQFSHYVKYGLTPAQAIQSSTRWASELMGWEDRVGSLTPGTFADIVGVLGNPVDDVRLLEDIGLVMKGGEMLVDPRPQSTRH